MKKILTLIFLSLIFCTPVLADVQIGEFIITDKTSPEEVIIYIFQIFVGVGALIAVAMVVLAGVEWMTSDGNPGKVDGAKSKIKNALLGVGVLLGTYLIIWTINPDIVDVKVDNLKCDYGIILKAKYEDQEKEITRCIDTNTTKIDYEIMSTENSGGWNFPPDSLLKVYAFSEENYKGTRTTFDFTNSETYSGDITGAKSVYFLKKNLGIYLYDAPQYNLSPDKTYPHLITDNVDSLVSANFDKKAQSIQIIQGETEKYRAIAFTSQNHEGVCSLIGDSVGNLSSWPIDSKKYSERLGNNAVSSLVVKKEITNLDAAIDRGYIVFYTTKNCGRPQQGGIVLPSIGTGEVKECRIDIKSTTEHLNILENCSGWNSGDAVLSFEIIGNAGLALSTSRQGQANADTTCKYFSTSSLGGGTCYADLSVTSVYNHWGRKPQSFIIISAD